MIQFIRTYVGRLAGAVIAGFVAWAASVGIHIDPDQAEAIQRGFEALVLAFSLAGYSIVHRKINKLVNPEDRADGEDQPN